MVYRIPTSSLWKQVVLLWYCGLSQLFLQFRFSILHFWKSILHFAASSVLNGLRKSIYNHTNPTRKWYTLNKILVELGKVIGQSWSGFVDICQIMFWSRLLRWPISKGSSVSHLTSFYQLIFLSSDLVRWIGGTNFLYLHSLQNPGRNWWNNSV